MNPKPTFAFRYDDYSSISSLETEIELVGAFASAGATLTLAVVPYVGDGDLRKPSAQRCLPLTGPKVRFLREAVATGAADVALHGLTHISRSSAMRTELAGATFKEQFRTVSEGKNRLEDALGARVDVIVPPWNAYDETTLDALGALNLSMLSGSLRGPFRAGPIRFVPMTCDASAAEDLRADGRRARVDSSGVAVVVLHPFDFRETGHPNAWTSVSKMTDLILMLSASAEVSSVIQLHDAGKSCSGRDLAANRWLNGVAGRFSWAPRRALEDQFCWPGRATVDVAWRLCRLNSVRLWRRGTAKVGAAWAARPRGGAK